MSARAFYSLFILFYLAWIIKSVNANILSSLQDDYLKNTEENMRSDESK